MHKFKNLLAGALSAGLVAFPLLAFPANASAATTLTQDDLDAIKAGTSSIDGLSYTAVTTSDGDTYGHFDLVDEDFVLGSNIELDDDDYLYLQSGNLDIQTYNIAGSLTIYDESLLLAATDASVTGTGTIEEVYLVDGTVSLSNFTANVIISTYEADTTIDNVTVNSYMQFGGDTTTTINSGSYNHVDLYGNGVLTINDGDFDSIYTYGDSVLTINGGTFTSEYSVALEDSGHSSITINDGTFTGYFAAIAIYGDGVPYSDGSVNGFTLNGGTYTATSGEYGAIVGVGLGTDGSVLLNLLGDGCYFSDSSYASEENSGFGLIYLTAASVTVYNGDASATSPDSGRVTAELGSAATYVAPAAAATIIVAAAYLATRKHEA